MDDKVRPRRPYFESNQNVNLEERNSMNSRFRKMAWTTTQVYRPISHSSAADFRVELHL